MQQQPMLSTIAASVVARLERGESFSTIQAMELQKEPGLITEFTRLMPSLAPKIRRRAVALLIELGRPLLKKEADLPERPAPVINHKAIVSCLVFMLHDSDPEIRNEAAAALIGRCLMNKFRRIRKKSSPRLQKNPTLDAAVLLLGRTSSEAAKRLIAKFSDIFSSEPEYLQMALARLGDHDSEERIMNAYLEAKEPRIKADLARRVGYIGTGRAVRVLATDIRTSEVYAWQMQARRSFRIHVIEALHKAYLSEPIFWKPFTNQRTTPTIRISRIGYASI